MEPRNVGAEQPRQTLESFAAEFVIERGYLPDSAKPIHAAARVFSRFCREIRRPGEPADLSENRINNCLAMLHKAQYAAATVNSRRDALVELGNQAAKCGLLVAPLDNQKIILFAERADSPADTFRSSRRWAPPRARGKFRHQDGKRVSPPDGRAYRATVVLDSAAVARVLKRDRWRPAMKKPPSASALEALVAAYLKKHRLGDDSSPNLRKAARAFDKWHQAKHGTPFELRDFSEALANDFVASLRNEGLASATLAERQSCIVRLYYYAASRRLVGQPDRNKIEWVQRPQPAGNRIEPEGWERLLAVVDREETGPAAPGFGPLEHRILLLIIRDTGLPLATCTQLKAADVDEDGWISPEATRSKATQRIPHRLRADTMDAIRRRGTGSSDRLAPWPYTEEVYRKRLKLFFKLAGLPCSDPIRTLRRSSTSILETVGAQLGHAYYGSRRAANSHGLRYIDPSIAQRRPQTSNADRNRYCHQQREIGKTFEEIRIAANESPDGWEKLKTPQDVMNAIERHLARMRIKPATQAKARRNAENQINDRPRRATSVPVAFRQEEIESLLAAIRIFHPKRPPPGWDNRHDMALVLFILDTGFGLGKCLALTKANLSDKVLTFEGRARELSPDTLDAIQAAPSPPTEPRLFAWPRSQNAYLHRLRILGRESGLPVSGLIQKLRRTWATSLVGREYRAPRQPAKAAQGQTKDPRREFCYLECTKARPDPYKQIIKLCAEKLPGSKPIKSLSGVAFLANQFAEENGLDPVPPRQRPRAKKRPARGRSQNRSSKARLS